MKYCWILFSTFFLLTLDGFSQTCCTGGVPYLGSFKIPGITNKEFSLNLSYSYNSNSDLILQDELIEDSGNSRKVSTALLQVDYGLSDKVSVSVLLPYMWQKEQIVLPTQEFQYTNNGLGDISLWSTYKHSFSNHSLAFSGAIKVPSGETDAVDPETGINLPFSFQSGSGSWDFIFNVYDEISLERKGRFYWVNMISAKLNTAGNKFDAHPGYRFGHIFQLYTSFSTRWVMGSFLADAYVGFAYQKRYQDEFDGGFKNENTGGDWINFVLGYNHQFSPKMHAGLSGSVPIFRKVNGLQLTTDKQVNVTFGYVF